MSYRIEIDSPNVATTMATLDWMAARGYDAGFRALAELVSAPENDEALFVDGPGVIVFEIEEHKAWEVQDAIDPGAFLACCGDSALIGALLSFVERVV